MAVSSAAGVLAESTRSLGPAAAASGAGPTAGGSSTMTWALVPPMPKELTPARRGVGPAGHSLVSVPT
ncbi:hypothetical protein SALBM135S_09158 [Streptomyces alboniger]